MRTPVLCLLAFIAAAGCRVGGSGENPDTHGLAPEEPGQEDTTNAHSSTSKTETTGTIDSSSETTSQSSSSSSSQSSSSLSSSSLSSSSASTSSSSNTDSSSGPNTQGCGSKVKITATFRDFSVAGATQHPDFESDLRNGLTKGMVQNRLDANHRPVAAVPLKDRVMTSAASFAQWYALDSNPSYTFIRELEFTETEANSKIYEYSNTQFFPIGPHEGWGKQDFEKNFGFTTEITIDFYYAKGQTFRFTGDDDLWIFIDDQLALDIGGMHGALTDEIDLDKQAAALNLQVGKMHRMRIFHAERHTTRSTFYVRANIGCIFVPG